MTALFGRSPASNVAILILLCRSALHRVRPRLNPRLIRIDTMARQSARALVYACCALLMALTGCANMSYTPGQRPDADSLNNALAIDDVHAIRGAINARVITPDERIVTAGYSGGAPILAIAARAGSLEVMRFLISAGADVNARTSAGETPLMLAAFFTDAADEAMGRGGERHEKAVRLLVSSGA